MALSPLEAKDHDKLGELTAKYFDVIPGNSAFFKASTLEERDWIAVIYECDLNKDACRISKAVSFHRWTRAICFNLEYHDDVPVHIALTEEDIAAVHRNYPAPSFAIMEINEQFAIVSDSDYFWAIAGPIHFVERICNKDILSDLDDFCEGIRTYLQSSDLHNRAVGQQLQHYLALCRVRFSEYKPGQVIKI